MCPPCSSHHSKHKQKTSKCPFLASVQMELKLLSLRIYKPSPMVVAMLGLSLFTFLVLCKLPSFIIENMAMEEGHWLILSSVIPTLIALVFFGRIFFGSHKKDLNLPPAVPGLPLIGNLLQLKEKKPHKTFSRWAEIYGPIYSIRTGASTLVVLNSTELAKEAMVKRFNSISTRKLPKALTLLTSNKAMVAMSDYDQFHKTVKRLVIKSLLGSNAQKRYRCHRDTMVDNICRDLHAEIKNDPFQAVKLREFFRNELFRLSLKQAVGKDIESIYVEELGTEITQGEMFNILVNSPMEGAIEVDWRDFFPYLSWVPNRSMEAKIQRIAMQKTAVTKALIRMQADTNKSGEAADCYMSYLLSEGEFLTEEQLTSLVWEVIIESSDTTLVTTEWAMFELAKHPDCQNRLYQEIRDICGSERVTEEHFPKLPYLSAVFHETLRRHSPVPIVPLRYAHENTELGGYHISAGSEIAINLYACNSEKETWTEPEKWMPERFLDEKYETADLFKTMAFGGGKRTCAGTLQAMFISCAAIGRFIQEFHWELKEGEEEKTDTVQLTTHKLRPMEAYLKPRQNNHSN